MKTIALMSAALLSTSLVAGAAYAQNKAIVPGSSTTQQIESNNERAQVRQDQPATTGAAEAPGDSEIVPGSESDQELRDQKIRNSVAAGTADDGEDSTSTPNDN